MVRTFSRLKPDEHQSRPTEPGLGRQRFWSRRPPSRPRPPPRRGAANLFTPHRPAPRLPPRRVPRPAWVRRSHYLASPLLLDCPAPLPPLRPAQSRLRQQLLPPSSAAPVGPRHDPPPASRRYRRSVDWRRPHPSLRMNGLTQTTASAHGRGHPAVCPAAPARNAAPIARQTAGKPSGLRRIKMIGQCMRPASSGYKQNHDADSADPGPAGADAWILVHDSASEPEGDGAQPGRAIRPLAAACAAPGGGCDAYITEPAREASSGQSGCSSPARTPSHGSPSGARLIASLHGQGLVNDHTSGLPSEA